MLLLGIASEPLHFTVWILGLGYGLGLGFVRLEGVFGYEALQAGSKKKLGPLNRHFQVVLQMKPQAVPGEVVHAIGTNS